MRGTFRGRVVAGELLSGSPRRQAVGDNWSQYSGCKRLERSDPGAVHRAAPLGGYQFPLSDRSKHKRAI